MTCPKKSAGFTLIEVLVVIAIIAIMASMLFPSIDRAYELARANQCASNHKALISAWTMYHSQNKRKLIGGGHHRENSYTKSCNGSGAVHYVTDWVVSGGAYNRGPFETEDDLKRSEFFEYVGSVKSYTCPNERQDFIRSYAASNLMNGSERWKADNNPHIVFNFAEISTPSKSFVYTDEADTGNGSWEIRNKNWNSFIQPYCPEPYKAPSWQQNSFAWIDVPPNNHIEGSIFGYADGHAKRYIFENSETSEIRGHGSRQGRDDLMFMLSVYRGKD